MIPLDLYPYPMLILVVVHKGTMEQLMGKATGNPDKVAHGQELKVISPQNPLYFQDLVSDRKLLNLSLL